ncbi:hypothetical protein BHE74_00055240 [Ensete ventricosum]|nr:hypothetical protein BHE74_00055240 [Ensete ventricosum]
MGSTLSIEPGYSPAPSNAFVDSQDLDRRVDDCGYDAQSNQRDLRSGMFGLSGCRGGSPRCLKADTSRLIDRNDVAEPLFDPWVNEMIAHVKFGSS